MLPTVLPEYACALIDDGHGRVLLQLRAATARHAANQLTCFGGRREAHEDDHACIQRELDEELGWSAPVAPCCDLWQATRWIARFFRCHWKGATLRVEAGSVAIWAPWSTLPGLPLSPWHAAVLNAVAAGRPRVDLA
jgi:8-oxo-dGTP pyrophosphatase MutT (NUDIX family)